jgi:hypothetical protein
LEFNEEVDRVEEVKMRETGENHEQKIDSAIFSEEYKRKLQNMKSMYEVELQNQFIKAQQSNSNAQKFEKDLQKQMAMKLSREEKLSLAVYQERYVQEFLKERYQVLIASNETLKQSLMGHECVE